jgi:hypothetical protein
MAVCGPEWGTESRQLADMKKGELLDENQCSIAFRVTYGKFDYFSGGDLDAKTRVLLNSSEGWQDVEPAAAGASGPRRCDEGQPPWELGRQLRPNSLRLLRPRVIVVTSRADGHPAQNTHERMLSKSLWPGPRDIFITNVTSSTRATTYNVDKAQSTQGHVVIRVDAGGAAYRVYSLDDSDEEQRVKAVFGPLHSELIRWKSQLRG